jgi:antitoxin component of RelBE/YafQ-DinJ toxin-antitoxin module
LRDFFVDHLVRSQHKRTAMKTISIRLPAELHREIARMADEQGLKPGQVIRSLLLRMVKSKQQEVAL